MKYLFDHIAEVLITRAIVLKQFEPLLHKV